MKTNSILLAAGFIALASMPVAAEDAIYLHTHKGTTLQALNKDTNFGSPATYNQYNRYRRNVDLQLSAAGVEVPQKLTLERRAVANFYVRNTSDLDLFLVIGDDRAIAETVQLISTSKSEAEKDFHVTLIKAGQVAQLAWRFDTFATPQVKMAVVNPSGRLADKALTVNVGPIEDRNYRMTGH